MQAATLEASASCSWLSCNPTATRMQPSRRILLAWLDRFAYKNRDIRHEGTVMQHATRRRFLQTAAGSLLAGLAPSLLAEDRPRSQPAPRTNQPSKKLAVVTTAYYYLSHAYHICGRFLHGYLKNGKMHYPDFALAGMYVEQQKENDLSRELAKRHGFKLYPDVAAALTLGGDKLAVDGVLLIGEHGDYPYNDKGQKLYPRYELFNKIGDVFRRSGRSVPVFCDKHLSYSWRQAKEMVETAKKLGFRLMAGSSLPVTWRRPELELPPRVRMTQALIASRGELEIFGIHALEALQCMVERRARTREPGVSPRVPPEQGVKGIQYLEGDEVWKAGDAGVWSWDLLEHALGRSNSLNVGDIRDNCRHFVSLAGQNRQFTRSPAAFVIDYLDGLRATVLILNGHVDDTTFAAWIEAQPRAISTLFYLPPPPGASFLQALTVKIEEFLTTGKPPYPVERTLLTGGMLDFVLESRVRKHERLETPELSVRYDPPSDSGFLRGAWTNPVE